MISDKLGHVFDRLLSAVARKIRFSPNALSIIGFILTLIASLVLTTNLRLGGILVLVGGLFDILDGVVARVNNKSSSFGAFLDSILDRYSDAFIILAVAWNLGNNDNQTGVILCLGILIGAFLISYSRARAEGLGKKCTSGLMERPERIILISFGAVSGYLMPVLWILLILTHVTVFQRIHYVWKTTHEKS